MRFFILCCLLVCRPLIAQDSPPATMTPVVVKLRMLETISSASAKVGQSVKLEVVDSVDSNGKVVVAAGAAGNAVVTTARKRGHNHREGRLVLTIKSVSLIDGRTAPLSAVPIQQGSGKGEPIFGPCTFPFPADPAGLFKKGSDVVIPKGTIVTAAVSYM